MGSQSFAEIFVLKSQKDAALRAFLDLEHAEPVSRDEVQHLNLEGGGNWIAISDMQADHGFSDQRERMHEAGVVFLGCQHANLGAPAAIWWCDGDSHWEWAGCGGGHFEVTVDVDSFDEGGNLRVEARQELGTFLTGLHRVRALFEKLPAQLGLDGKQEP